MPLQPGAFLETIIAYLLPYFLEAAKNPQEARQEILATLAAYETNNRAELLLAAQIIALGLSTLDALADAKSPDTPPAMRIRHRGNANSLNRSAIQTEKTLDRRQAIAPAPTHDNHLWAGAMIDTLKQMGIPVRPDPGG
jgi:hypothetical protein